jgi:soluble lytic murein transglycosylase-like protein
VRTALSAAVARAAPPKPASTTSSQRLAYLRWLGTPASGCKPRKADGHTRVEFLETVWYESRRAGLETALVLGLIQVESGFRKYAISSAGARGYMQVMPFWAR